MVQKNNALRHENYEFYKLYYFIAFLQLILNQLLYIPSKEFVNTTFFVHFSKNLQYVDTMATRKTFQNPIFRYSMVLYGKRKLYICTFQILKHFPRKYSLKFGEKGL